LTGLRIGELLALRWRDIDLNGGLLRVCRTVYEGHFDEPKTRSSNRTVPLSVKGVEILSCMRPKVADPDELVFGTQKGTPLCRRNLTNRQLVPVCDELKIPKIRWHSKRTQVEEIRNLGSTLIE
jgi:integrase